MTQSEVVHLTVNDQPHAVAKGATVSDLLRQLGLSSGQVAVERNRQLVRRAQHAETPLAEGDRLEVVTFLGGG